MSDIDFYVLFLLQLHLQIPRSINKKVQSDSLTDEGFLFPHAITVDDIRLLFEILINY